MLIKFTFENYKSFQTKNTLNVIAAPISELEASNIHETNRLRLLKSISIYGANASGKSNLLDALNFMRWFVLNSSRNTQTDEPIDVKPFRLNTATENAPCFFEVEFLIKKTRYRYGFMATSKKVEAEWLFISPRIKEYVMFVRRGNEYQIDDRYKEGKDIQDKTRDNALFLSVVAQFNGKKSSEVLHWFNNIEPIHGLRSKEYIDTTINMLSDARYSNSIKKLIADADLGIDDVRYQKGKILEDIKDQIDEFGIEDFETLESLKNAIQSDNKGHNVVTFHKKYDKSQKLVGEDNFILSKQESAGTEKYFNIIGILLKAIKEGNIVIIDELDARLHPLLCKGIVKMFNSVENKQGQLIFATHDTNILDNKLLRRDQIYFVEKNEYGSSNTYSLVEFKPRKESSIRHNYLKGKFGAIPFIGEFKF